MEIDGVIHPNWFDIHSHFRDETLREPILKLHRGALPSDLYEPSDELIDRRFVDKESGRIFEIGAPMHAHDALLTAGQAVEWFGRYLIDTVVDPVLFSMKAYLDNRDAYPALKAVEERSTGAAKTFFIERLTAERAGEALLRALETGWPLRLFFKPPGDEWDDVFDVDDPHSWPLVHELAPHDLARRLFNGADGSVGWIQRWGDYPAIKDQMRGWAPII